MHEKPSGEIDPKLWRPFLRLGKYVSEDFLKLAEEWLFLVREYGISKIATRPTSEEEFLVLLAHVHDGWKEAQTRIAVFLTDALTQLGEGRASEKEHHRLKDKEGQKKARAMSKRLTLEIAIARRMLDVILWTIFEGDQSTLRRLHVDGGENNLNAPNIADAMKAANNINQDPQVMALSTDMLSFVHVGDLIVANRSAQSISFVELKSGERNADISAAAQFAVQSQCQHFEGMTVSGFDDTDRKHYERVKRQVVRNETIVQTIRNEGGTDPNTGNKVVIHATENPPAFWSERIMRCYEKLCEGKIWAIDTIDECVFLGVYSDQQIAFVGFQAWMRKMRCDSQVFSLTDSFHDPGVRPLGATFLSLELQRKVLSGEILVIMCLDILKMIEWANRMQPNFLRLATRAESARMRNKRFGNFTLDGRYVQARIGDDVMYLGGGFRDRILFDQHHPSQLLANHLAAYRSTSGTANS